jgi:NAD(P)H-hydrate epimerase
MRELGIPGIVLMENAGRSMAELLLARVTTGPVLVCCGKGNNGGDGMVIARHLDIAGVPVKVLLFTEKERVKGDANVNLTILHLSGIPVEALPGASGLARELSKAEWVVDALFGTGLEDPVRPPLTEVIEAINASGKAVFSVDCPSGMDVDTGGPLGCCVRATVTATVQARKVGFDAPGAGAWLGEVVVVGMGAPRALDVR